ncbi:Deoxynucleotidyltransferase terminal-interacting protein 2 [Balamuthia mandrillaris]
MRRRTRRACPSSSSSDCDAKQKQQVVEEGQRTCEATATAEEELAAINSLTRDQVRVQLRRRGRRTSGLKSQLVKRLREAILEDQQKGEEEDILNPEEENAEEQQRDQQSAVREETPLEETAEQESDKMGKRNKRQQRKPKPTQRNVDLKKEKEERHIDEEEEEQKVEQVQTVQIEKQKVEEVEEEEAEEEEEEEEEQEEEEEEEETELDEILQAATLSLNKHLQTMTKGGGDAGERGSSISQEFQRIRERNRSHTTKLQSGLEDTELYLTPKAKAQLDEGRRGKAHNEEEEEDYHSGKLRTRTAVTLQVGSQVDSLLKESLIPALHKRETAPPLDSRKEKKKEKKPETAGRGWFDLPAPEMTAELKRDLQMIRLRNYMDPKHHYKRIPKRGPKYFQIGTIVDGPTDFYSSRIPKRDRKRTIVEEVMADEQARQWAKRKFSELQRSKQAAGRKKTTPKKKSKQSHRT